MCDTECQTFILAHNPVSFLNSITLSLIQIGVSWGEVLGWVDLGSKASIPPFLKAFNHLFKLLSLYGQTLTKLTIDTSLSNIGLIHLYLSSFMFFDILIDINH